MKIYVYYIEYVVYDEYDSDGFHENIELLLPELSDEYFKVYFKIYISKYWDSANYKITNVTKNVYAFILDK